MVKWVRRNGINVGVVNDSFEQFEVHPRRNEDGTAKRSGGYDIYHRTQTRRLWVGFEPTVKAAQEFANGRAA